MRPLDVRQLHQVLEICRSGSFAGAARALAISQPALSRSIARMEDQLRVKLFDRDGGGAVPTVFGEYVARQAVEVLARAGAIESEVRQLAAGEAGLVRIGAGAATMAGVIPLLVDRILDRFPKLSLVIERDVGAGLIARLERRELDMVVSNVPARAHAGYVEDRLDEMAVAYVVHAGHPILETPGPYSFADVLRYRFASPGLPATPDVEVLGSVPFEYWPNYRAVVAPDFPVLKRICLKTDCVAAGPAFIFAEDIAAGRLVRLPLSFSSAVAASVVVNPESSRSPVLTSIRRMAREAWDAFLAQ